MTPLNINTVRCEALFASSLQRSDDASPAQVQAAVLAAVRAWGSRGCAAQVAQEFGDHPETALPRMQWARDVIARTYGLDRSQLLCGPSTGVRTPGTVRRKAAVPAAGRA
jgi:hypothetical protein